ncbi:MAG: hypothetical protein A2600_08365 [Candidatus Lambdaproteobacteria bacterium RIFOXYD1_FULL_56_27]|uniref:4-alpha-glucanotransferase n=1 Tax=Candidatus Lambdaproteobacteria bacterium RIFOXYD2_FULL_56_26 TaxID=1817773 RepID=A0A1F6H071_9PROT|nr:MAG: hypothetical protein A2426_06715 [Candidatus Lambdaproteobacteria bacterium RIFOXYC1_FULL_56_13]OGH03798.1 MAG: hypothetical protein A2557_13690 [Candidatus Lambdaproteobacteria bacterium RIFOXYD2_FULL_56_26]OGH08793.1 MAG: hypothetical protein A2600_08365 [Candidatus Lambdaproteobacteria bacterium RIFOXYD1_FULL_56_27]
MKFNLLVGTSQINSLRAKSFGSCSADGLRHLGELLAKAGIQGDILDLPNGSRNPGMASPFSINSGFALNPDELNLNQIPELNPSNPVFEPLKALSRNYNQCFRGQRSLSYQLKRTLWPWILEGCFQVFSAHRGGARAEQYRTFVTEADFWLKDYALFMAAKEAGLGEAALKTMEVPVVREAFELKEADRIGYHRYVQFLCFEQRLALLKDLRALGIGLIVNLPFGVDFYSPDALFHPEAFDLSKQVGCSPEPEHGYPEQAWGMPVYKERSAGLERYLKARMGWLARLSDGIFIDHLVGWCGQYVLDKGVVPSPGQQSGSFLTQDPAEREANILWYLDLVLSQGLRILGEVAGDQARVQATQQGVLQRIEAGAPIHLMRVPRWEREGKQMLALKDYPAQSLLMVETHDTSTLLQYLINQKGRHKEFVSQWDLLEFCRQVLGLPVFLPQVPLSLEQLTDEFCREILARLALGSPAQEFVMTLPSLLSWLSPAHRNPSKTNNINVLPGTSGEVGNEEGNWSFFSPPIELLEEPELQATLRSLGQRRFKPFEPLVTLEVQKPLEVLFGDPTGREILQLSEGQWELYRGPERTRPGLRELVIANLGEDTVQGFLRLDRVLDLGNFGGHAFCDLNQKAVVYLNRNGDLKQNGLFFRLAPHQIHHFLVWPAMA